jgi:hypothetical protein
MRLRRIWIDHRLLRANAGPFILLICVTHIYAQEAADKVDPDLGIQAVKSLQNGDVERGRELLHFAIPPPTPEEIAQERAAEEKNLCRSAIRHGEHQLRAKIAPK